MHLYSPYDYYQRKFQTEDNIQLRKRLMAYPAKNLLDLNGITLVQPSPFKGLKILKLCFIDGFTHTTARDTTVPNADSNITIARYYEEDDDKLLHPDLPLLAIRTRRTITGELEYEYVSRVE